MKNKEIKGARLELMFFAAKLKEAMKELKITEEEMAKACNKESKSTIANYKAAKRRPDIDTIKLIAKKLKKPVDEVNGWLVE